MAPDETTSGPSGEGALAGRLLSWLPLFLGAVNSYGPVAFNYGFALYFLSYSHGFVKRGLVGELFSPIRWLPRERLLAMEYLFLAAAYALTYVVFRKLLFGTLAERRLSVALLCAPALLPHLGYLFAQPDVTLYMFVLLCLWLFVRCRVVTAVVVSAVLCCAALLTHEAFCLMFYPLVAAILLHLVARRRLHWLVAASHVALFAAAFLAVMHWGTLKVSPDTITLEATARTNVGVQRQVYDVMASSFTEQEALVRRMYSPMVRNILAVTILLIAPYVWLLCRLVSRTMRAGGASVFQQRMTMLMFASPLLLCALGHDTTRWIGAGCIDATLFLLFVYQTDQAGGGAREYLNNWTNGSGYLTWVIYLVGVGPLGATGLRAAGELVSAWQGP